MCLIYGNESQNGRSSSFGHENGGQQYWPLDGIDDNLGYDMQYPDREFEISYQGKNESLQLLKPQHVLKNFVDHQGRDTRST